MRTIRFRGKDANGKWQFGTLLVTRSDTFIVDDPYFIKVNPDTIGQYTGFNDKHGQEIYEGDIVKVSNRRSEPIKGVVQYEDRFTRFEVRYREEWMTILHNPKDFEVIGSIHDNPELLKTDE